MYPASSSLKRFWCSSYERTTPNSNRCIEVEVLNRFLRDFAISSTSLPYDFEIPTKFKEIITSDDPELVPYPQMTLVLRTLNTAADNRFLCQQKIDKGRVSTWPIKFLYPQKLKIKTNAAFRRELSSFFEDLFGSDLTYIQPRYNKDGRCVVNGQRFSSDFNSTDRGSIVKCMFVDNTNELAPYYGIVKFYFTVRILIQQEASTHHLAYVTWLKFRNGQPDPVSKLYSVTNDCYQRDRIVSPRRFICRCVLVPYTSSANSFMVSELPK